MDEVELRVAIAKSGLQIGQIAEKLGISPQAFYNKTHGTSEFKGSEIKTLAECLRLGFSDVNRIFFSDKVN